MSEELNTTAPAEETTEPINEQTPDVPETPAEEEQAEQPEEVPEEKAVNPILELARKTLSDEQIIERENYTIFIVPVPEKESLLNDLRASGKTFGEITVTVITGNDYPDEVIIAVKN
jgi:hypothetical protein